MKSSEPWRTIIIAAALCVLSSTAIAAGSACPARPTQEVEARELASSWFSLGEQLVKHSAFVEAVAAFECSLSMVEHTATLYNAGQAALLAGDKRKALSFFERYLARARPYDDLTEAVEKQARDLRSELKSSDNLLDATNPMTTGPVSNDPRGPSDLVTPTESSDGSADEPPKDRSLSLVIGSFSIAGGAAVLGIAFNIAAVNRYDRGSEATSLEMYNDAEHDLRVYRGWAIAGYTISAAAVASGIYLVLKGRKVSDSSALIVPSSHGCILQIDF